MSTNPQWKSFQPPDNMNQDSAIIDFKPLNANNGKSPQAFNNFTSRSASNPRFGQDFSTLQEKISHSSSQSASSFNSHNSYGTSVSNNNKRGTANNNQHHQQQQQQHHHQQQQSTNNHQNRFGSIVGSGGGGGGNSTAFPQLDNSNNIFNSSSSSSGGDNGLATSNSVFSNGGSNTSNLNISNSFGNNNNSSSGNNNNDPNAANMGTRETGIIEKLLHSYGFIQCCERQARLFFHFSQFSGNIEHLKIGDPVEFEMTYDRRTGKPIASSVTKIAPEVVLSEERVTGNVTTELKSEGSVGGDTTGRISYENRGECFFLPYTKDDVEGNVTLRSGDKVSFQIATNNRGNLGACHVRLENPAHPVKYQGVVCSMKESFGFIERADVVKEIFFHFSEAKTKEELRLGDDVEFIIQTRNNKEVACNIIQLPLGTVIFEDLKPDILKGQVLKTLDRGGSNNRNQSDALPGRIRYRAADHSEVEIAFGDKDQRGDFTLRHGDWVQFQIATDRRDGLNRATNISLLDESFVVSGEKREQGVVNSLKEGYGLIKCVEREPRLFFRFNEILDVEHVIQIGDEYEFTVIQHDQTNNTFSGSVNAGGHQQQHRQYAIRMKLLPTGTVQFETRIESKVAGVISKDIPPSSWLNRSPIKVNGTTVDIVPDTGIIEYDEKPLTTATVVATAATDESNSKEEVMNKKKITYYLKDCDMREYPRLGDKVEFNINQVKRNKEFIAVDIKIVEAANGINQNSVNNGQIYQGFIAALKEGFGFIETVEHDREIFFHYSNFNGNLNTLELGLEVEYNLANRGTQGMCLCAENVKIVPKGTIIMPTINDDILDGIVVRPLRSLNPDQKEYSGLIQIQTENVDEEPALYEFGIMSLVNKRELLQMNDHVQLQVDSSGRAANIEAVRKKLRATVDSLKGSFGFLNYEVEEGKKLFFHMTEVKENTNLAVGDKVEFVLVNNQRTGKSSGCNLVKIDIKARPERLISRLRTVSLDENGPRSTVLRQPKGPDGSKGFSPLARTPRSPGAVFE